MDSEKLDEKAIFSVAREIVSKNARAEYLHQVCGADADLRERIETLLLAYEEQASFLESPPAGASPALDQPPREKLGTQIGPYKLLEKIGEGGMGNRLRRRTNVVVEASSIEDSPTGFTLVRECSRTISQRSPHHGNARAPEYPTHL